MNPSDSKLPFKMNRHQFPIIPSFAMTINKSQGQSMNNVGLYLSNSMFSHGQLYVALSRVKSIEGLKVLIIDKDKKPTNITTNVVYTEAFQNIIHSKYIYILYLNAYLIINTIFSQLKIKHIC